MASYVRWSGVKSKSWDEGDTHRSSSEQSAPGVMFRPPPCLMFPSCDMILLMPMESLLSPYDGVQNVCIASGGIESEMC